MLFTSLHFLDFYNYMYLKFYPLDIFVPTRLEPTSNLLNIKMYCYSFVVSVCREVVHVNFLSLSVTFF